MSSLELIRAAAADMEASSIRIEKLRMRNTVAMKREDRIAAAEECAVEEAKWARAYNRKIKAQMDYARGK